MNLRRFVSIWLGVAFALAGATAARAQFTVTLLGSGPGNSHGFGAAGGQQVGIQDSGAALWTGSAGSLVVLNPAGAFSSIAYTTNGTQQGGSANFTNTNFADHAGLWSGTAGSFVDLHPGGAATASIVVALTATAQGGSATYAGVPQATWWNGTAGSATNVHPAGATQSEISAMLGNQQAGFAMFAGDPHAGLWSGTAASFIDLNPAGANLSFVYALSGSTQAGAAYFSSVPHAALWSGTAGSFVDLDPGGTAGSILLAAADSYFAGVTVYGGDTHATLWNGAAPSAVDLQSFITGATGPSYTSSIIRSATIQGGTLYLVGDAIDPVAASHVAFLVTTAIPEPATTAGLAGLAGLALAWRRRRGKVRR